MISSAWTWLKHTYHLSTVDLIQLNALRGHIVGSWASIESAIDLANMAAWQRSGRTVAVEIPLNFNRKVKLFRKIHRQPAFLEPLEKQAISLLERVLPHMESRHYLVHGYTIPKRCDSRGWLLAKHSFTANGLETVERYFKKEELKTLSRDLLDLVSEAADYLNAVTGKLQDQQVKYLNGKLSS